MNIAQRIFLLQWVVQFRYTVAVLATQSITAKFTMVAGAPAAKVNWGDGTDYESVTSAVELSHTYSANGTYQVELIMPSQYRWVSEVDISYNYMSGTLWYTEIARLGALTKFSDPWVVGYGAIEAVQVASL